jgi:integrase/recombinase XerD
MEILGTGRVWLGRRDRALLLLAVQTGLRVSELTGHTNGDAHLGAGPHVAATARAERPRDPLTRQTVQVLRTWLADRGGEPGQPLFAIRAGRALSRDIVERLVAEHACTPAAT